MALLLPIERIFISIDLDCFICPLVLVGETTNLMSIDTQKFMDLTLYLNMIWASPLQIAIAMWQIKKKDSPFVDDHGREAVNFQLSLILYSFALPAIAAIIGVLTLGVGFLLMLPAIALPFVLGLVGMIMGMIAANRGEYFRYPMTIRFIS